MDRQPDADRKFSCQKVSDKSQARDLFGVHSHNCLILAGACYFLAWWAAQQYRIEEVTGL